MRDVATMCRAALLALALAPYANAHADNAFFARFLSTHTQQQGPGRLITVRYAGVQVTMHVAEIHALHRCAQIAAEAGKPYFALYKDLPDALADRRSTVPEITTIQHAPSAVTYILLQDNPGPGLLSTHKLLRDLDPQVNGVAR
jgi:hypothetical protein